MRRFVLDRSQDISGVSGTGVVAEGVEFTDGSVAVRWLTELKSTVLFADIETAETIHGHNGSTRIVWLDEEP